MTTIMSMTPRSGGELARVEVETLADAYLWLEEVRASHASFLLTRKERVSKLDARARYILGSLKAARRFIDSSSAAKSSSACHAYTEAVQSETRPSSGASPDESSKTEGEEAGASTLVPKQSGEDPLSDIVERTREELEAARSDLDRWSKEEETKLAEAFEAAEKAVIERTEAYSAHQIPLLRVEVARLAQDRCIVHVHRPGDDEAVVLCWLLTGRPPSRHDYLRDDSLDAVDEQVHLAVREHELDPKVVSERGADAEDALARDGKRRLLPIRAHLPVLIPDIEWPRLRMRTRGPVLELESRGEGGEYSHLIEGETCELFTGYLLSLRARGLLEIDIQVP